MLRVCTLQVDVRAADHDAAVAYWAAALGGHDGGSGAPPFTHLHEVRSPLPVHLQRIAGADDGRYHLDLVADDVAAEVARLEQLGAVVVATGDWTVLRDPAGLLLCLVGEEVEDPLRAGVPPEPRVHLVVLDVPSDRLDAVVRFWSEALGLGVHPVGGAFAAYTFLGERPAPPLDGWGLLVQDIGDDATARLHVDLHVPTPTDRDREVVRLEGLGAVRVGGHDRWVVLRAPGGHLHCIVADRPA